jgi:hypothetical protein
MVGIHTNGSSTGNSATRITSVVAENLRRWAIEGGRQLPAPTRRYQPQIGVSRTQMVKTPEEVVSA